MADKIIKLALLNLPKWGSISARKLIADSTLDKLSDPEGMFEAMVLLAKTHKRITIPCLAEIQHAFCKAHSILAQCEKYNIQVLTEAEASYPIRFASSEIKPLVLYAKGNFGALNHKTVFALIGTRKAEPWVLNTLRRLGCWCAENRLPY